MITTLEEAIQHGNKYHNQTKGSKVVIVTSDGQIHHGNDLSVLMDKLHGQDLFVIKPKEIKENE